MNKILHIIRWKNLLMIVGVQLMIRYYLMPIFYDRIVFSNLPFYFLVLATLCIAAGGYIINDIYDIAADKINKPQKVWIPTVYTLKTANIMYYAFTGVGLILGFLVSYILKDYAAFIYFLLPSILLYVYAVWLKKKLIVGNLIVSILVAFSLVVVALFIPDNLSQSNELTYSFWAVIWGLVFFVFILNLIREIVKDAEDSIGDKVIGVVSIPIKYGLETTNMIILLLSSSIIGVVLALSYYFYNIQLFLSIYLVFAVAMGFLLFLIQLNKATKNHHYTKLSLLLKLLMFVGLLSVFLI